MAAATTDTTFSKEVCRRFFFFDKVNFSLKKKMARDYFLQTTSLVPPRGVRVEMTEIKPLRPNQATILPGVAVMGQGMRFEVNRLLLETFLKDVSVCKMSSR